ncbi:MAG TPA: cupin-like domain-containing protein [Polyangiaceae bacterium]|jgi:hypothetical protein|nr:cupin-like domain-containing protein [Polyangiaceae bacterium]
MDDWEAPETWTLERLDALLGESQVVVRSRVGAHARAFDYRRVPFRDVIASAKNDGPDYLVSSPALAAVPELAREIRSPPYVGRLSRPPVAFVGPKAAVTPLHYDLHHGLLAQVSGRKQVTLASFKARDIVSNWELRGPARLSEPIFDGESSSASPAPERVWQCTLSPRQMLFIPALVHHCVRCVDPVVSLSFTWHTAPLYVVAKIGKFLAGSYMARSDQIGR